MSGAQGGTTTEQGNGGTGGTGGTEQGGGKTTDDGFKPVTYNTQDELNAAFADRATRAAEAARTEALKSLPSGVDMEAVVKGYTDWKAAEDAKKDPAVLAAEKTAEVQRELDAYKAKDQLAALRTEVAKDESLKFQDTPIPAELLAGSNKEEMLAHGKALIAFIEVLANAGVRTPQYNPLQGTSGTQQAPAVDPIRGYLATGQF